MKITQIAGLLVLSVCTLISCNEKKTSMAETLTITDTLANTQPTAAADTGTRVISANGVLLADNEVPDTIRAAFKTKYPRVTRSQYYSYQSHADDDLEIDQSYYYVRFNDNGADYTSWFDSNGDWVKTSTKVPGNKNLPDAVNRYLNVNYPGYAIEEISKENDKNINMYEIKLGKGDRKVKLKILPNGKVFKRKSN